MQNLAVTSCIGARIKQPIAPSSKLQTNGLSSPLQLDIFLLSYPLIDIDRPKFFVSIVPAELYSDADFSMM